jgi:hypothetical protein
MIARETVYVALLNLLTTTGSFKLVSRRNRAPESIGPTLSPALFLFERGETYHVISPGMPVKRCLKVSACFYNDVGADLNATPTTLVNNALDALDAILTGDPATGRTTLGGLVYSIKQSGDTEGSPGDREGKAVAIVPLEIILP